MKTTSFTYKIQRSDEGERLDNVLAKRPEIASRSFASRLINKKLVVVNGRHVNKSFKVKADQVINYQIPEPMEAEIEPQDLPIDIVYQDSDLAVIDKPASLVVHPSFGHWEGTLVNALLFHLKDLSTIGGIRRPGIVHRLDKDTSGLMLVAKNDSAHLALSKAIKERQVTRKYLALVHGNFKQETFSVEAPISRHPINRKKMAVSATGRYAKTNAKVLKQFKEYALLSLTLVTGRTHQIRVHLSYINHPVVGDSVYGYLANRNSLGLTRPFLHAYKLSFNHPRTGKHMDFESPLPEVLQAVLDKLS